MRIWAEGLELEVAHGVTARDIVAFAQTRGVRLPERPWCGAVRLSPSHPVGTPPLVAFASLTRARGPDAAPDPGTHLAIVGGPDAGAVATLTQGLVVGRSPDAALQIADPAVSGAHLVVGDGTVRDAGTRNGTRLNGRRVRRSSRLNPGDTLTFGDTTAQVVGPGAQPPQRHRAAIASVASGGAAALSMTILAIATGHWQLALVALVLPCFALAPAIARRVRKPAPSAILDVTGTLGCDPLPPGHLAVRGPAGLMRAVTLDAGRPPASARQWEEWMELLPPADRDVAWLRDDEETPSWAVVTVTAERGHAVMRAAGVTRTGPLPIVSERSAAATARRRASQAAGTAIAGTVRWAELPQPHRGGLPVRLGMGAHGPVVLDLVADGPHVLVAGTTGSGKSEALRTIIGSLASDFGPQEVQFALLDFKGGAGLGDCATLPHTASILTDLEPHLARRCLLALGAELTARKVAAASAGTSAFDDWTDGPPPRLVVVVDEFQEIAAADRDFLPQLARLAAQGRSLGMHLVLATQRPAGAVAPEIRANISATVALRTATDAESRDLIGTGAAATIDPAAPGRALLKRGAVIEEVQVALPLAQRQPALREAAVAPPLGPSLLERPRAGAKAAPLWLPQLPARVAPAPSQSGRFVLGVGDVPAERRRTPVTWDPAAGALVVAGPPRSGRSSVLVAIGAQAQAMGLRPVLVPRTPRLAVRTLELAIDTKDCVLLVDDAARVMAEASTADAEAIDLLTAALVRMPTALVVPSSWAHHRIVVGAATKVVMAGLPHDDDAAWDVPRDLRAMKPTPGRARVLLAEGWLESQLCAPAPWRPRPLAAELPTPSDADLPATVLGVGGDTPRPVTLTALPAAVVGPPGPEREAVARRVETTTGTSPIVVETALSLGMPGSPVPRSVVITRPTQRALREVARGAPRGLVDPHPPPFRVVVVSDGQAQAVQVLAA